MARFEASDRQLALCLGGGLFLAVAWPLFVLRVPPYQDLPGHLAAVTILANPSLYPELVPTGFLKPNSFFFLFTLNVGRSIGFVVAAKVFVLLTLAAVAFALPRFVLHFGDRRRMIVATPLLVPMIHNWFVSMGMLNFALALAPALLLVMELDRLCSDSKDGGGSPWRAAGLALLGWYLHPFPIVVIALMAGAAVLAEVVEKTDRPLAKRLTRLRAMLPPLVPAGVAALVVLGRHAAVAGPGMDNPVYSPLNWAIYNVWSQWMYGFTELTAVSLVPAIVLAVVAVARWRHGPTILGPLPWGVTALAYLLGPYVAFDANYITPRLIPFLWMGALARIPDRLPRPIRLALVGSAAIYVGGMGIDLIRLSRELDDFAAGTAVIPEGARLLPLNFNSRVTSKNTFSLGTASGLYVVERHTSAIDAWANVPSMPIMLKEPLPPALESMTRLRFVKNAATKEKLCAARRAQGLPSSDCTELWRAEWDAFWQAALPSFDFILLWDPPPDLAQTIPPSFRESFAKGRLHILQRFD